MHSFDPRRTQVSLTNPLWLNYSMCTFEIRLYGRHCHESQTLLMQREPGQMIYGNSENTDTNLVKNWIVTRASKYQIST